MNIDPGVRRGSLNRQINREFNRVHELGLPLFSRPRRVYGANRLLTAGSNITSVLESSGTSDDASPLSGTPTESVAAGVRAIDLSVPTRSLDAGASPAIPTGSFILYVAVMLPALVGSSDAQYVLGQYYATDPARTYFGYSGGAGRLAYGVGSGNKQLTLATPSAGVWSIWTVGVDSGVNTIMGIDETEELFPDDLANPSQSQGNQIGALSTTGGTYNSSSVFGLRGYIAHLSVWDGFHTAEQRTAMRSAISKRYGL